MCFRGEILGETVFRLCGGQLASPEVLSVTSMLVLNPVPVFQNTSSTWPLPMILLHVP